MEDDDELARYLEEDVKVGNCIVANANIKTEISSSRRARSIQQVKLSLSHDNICLPLISF